MKRTLLYLSVLGLIGSLAVKSHAQYAPAIEKVDTTNTSTIELDNQPGSFPKKALQVLKSLNISGYYRFVANYRHLSEAYTHLASTSNNIFLGDDSQIPQLMLNINGSPIKNVSFGTDLYIWTPMTGMGPSENVKGLNLGISLNGKYLSPVGEFYVQAGGINWYSLSPFTFGANKGYNRYSVF